GLLDDMDFVNSHPFRCSKHNLFFEVGNVFIENEPNCTFGYANFMGEASKGLINGLLTNPTVQSGSHALTLDNIRQPLCVSFSTITTPKTAGLDVNTNPFPVHGKVFNQHLLTATTN